MAIEIFTPTSREEWLQLRKDTIGASEIAAVIGEHPYLTPFKLWALKTGRWANEETKAMRRGRMLEDDCVDILREERPKWAIQHNVIGDGGSFYCDTEIGISATPDAFAWEPSSNVRPEFGVCQIKTVSDHVFHQRWMVNGNVYVPAYIAIQTIQEAHLAGASWACVVAFVGMDLEPHIMDVKLDVNIMDKIRNAVPEFLRCVRENDPPCPDYTRDAEIIRSTEDDGGEVDLSNNGRVSEVLGEREILKQKEAVGAAAAEFRRALDAELIHILGNAARGSLGDGRYIEAKTVRRKEYVQAATTFRTVMIKQRNYADGR